MLDVSAIAADDCLLFMWTTGPQFANSIDLGNSWGFEYKTVAFVWVKQNKKSDSLFWGMGYWTRANAELCILATKGRPKRQNAGVHQIIMSHIEEHSKKPQEARDRIITLMGDVPRLEMFARQKTEGWDVGGNEVECDVDLEGSEKIGVCTSTERPYESKDKGNV